MTIEGVTHRLDAAVPRHRDPEPDRVRGHVPAARGAARPLPAADGVRLPEPRRRGRRAHAPHRARGRRRRARAGHRPRDAPRDAARRRDACTSPRASASTASTSSRRRATSQSAAVGASPRGSLALLKLARCRAALQGRDYVLPDDVKAIAVPALAHRLVLRPELWVQRVSAEDVVREVLESVPTPRAEDVAPQPARDARREPAPRRLRGARRRSGSSARSPCAGPSSPSSPLPSPSSLALGSRARDPRVAVDVHDGRRTDVRRRRRGRHR